MNNQQERDEEKKITRKREKWKYQDRERWKKMMM